MDDGGAIISVMMPVYNEVRTVGTILRLVLARPEVRDVIVVDDGSTDGTWELLQRVADGEARVRLLRHRRNQGKGSALRLAIQHLTAPYALVQDADLEYDPSDYAALLRPLTSGRADAVNGVRGFGAHTAYSYWFVKGNHALTLTANVLFNCYVTDLLSGYKVLRSDLWRRLNLVSRGFEVDTEIIAKVVRLGYRVHEVPITYITRSRSEGKKIRARDALPILATLLRVRVSSPRRLFATHRDADYHHNRQQALAEQHPLIAAVDGLRAGAVSTREE